MEATHDPLYLRQMKFGTPKDQDTSVSFTLIIIFSGWAFEHGDGVNFEVKTGQKLNDSVYSSVTLCTDIIVNYLTFYFIFLLRTFPHC
jgi:hypothetical protein